MTLGIIWTPVGIELGSIHIWRQIFLGHFWPTYQPSARSFYEIFPIFKWKSSIMRIAQFSIYKIEGTPILKLAIKVF